MLKTHKSENMRLMLIQHFPRNEPEARYSIALHFTEEIIDKALISGYIESYNGVVIGGSPIYKITDKGIAYRDNMKGA